MKTFLIIGCMLALWCVASANPVRRLPALRREVARDEFGQYAIRYINRDNMVHSEAGRFVPTKDGGYVFEVKGQYDYMDADGKIYKNTFIVGPDGYRVTARRLPVST